MDAEVDGAEDGEAEAAVLLAARDRDDDELLAVGAGSTGTAGALTPVEEVAVLVEV